MVAQIITEPSLNKRWHYYTPAERIELVPGVKRQRGLANPTSTDTYSGTGETLERSGLLCKEMLPAPGRVKISWRASNIRKEGDESCFYVPGYMTIWRQPDGTFRADLTVSREEQAARKAHAKALEEQERREWEKNEEARKAERQAALDRKQEERGSSATAGDVRECYLSSLYVIKELAPREKPFIGCQFNYSAETREQMMNLVRQIDTLIRTAAMLPLRRPGGSRGHLRLAWTAEHA